MTNTSTLWLDLKIPGKYFGHLLEIKLFLSFPVSVVEGKEMKANNLSAEIYVATHSHKRDTSGVRTNNGRGDLALVNI